MDVNTVMPHLSVARDATSLTKATGWTQRTDDGDPLGGWAKRTTDIVVAVTALVVLAPLLIMVAFAIMMTIGRPVIFGHTRVGQGGRPFKCFKFRTMAMNSEELLRAHLANNPEAAEEWSRTQKLVHDPRVTPFGQLLRKTSIDEFPQLVNVLRGEMSCVGPRPVVPQELCRYGSDQDSYLKAKPGITGPWQISGRNGLSYDARVALDREYVKNWSYSKDVRILLKTIPAVTRFNETA